MKCLDCAFLSEGRLELMMNPVSKTKRQPTISLGKDEEERGAFMTRIEIVKRVWFYYDDF